MNNLEFVDLKGYEGLYKINRIGELWSCTYNRKIKSFLSGEKYKEGLGYYSVVLQKDRIARRHKIHRLVALQFIPNPNNYPQVNHIDANRQNNNVENLEWCTKGMNMQHAYRMGHLSHFQDGKARPQKRKHIIGTKDGISTEFIGITETAKLLGVRTEVLSCTLRGLQKTCAGYTWKYAISDSEGKYKFLTAKGYSEEDKIIKEENHGTENPGEEKEHEYHCHCHDKEEGRTWCTSDITSCLHCQKGKK